MTKDSKPRPLMKLSSYSGNNELKPVADFVEYHLDGSDYERGQLEEIEAGTEKLRQAFGRFLELQVIKGVLTKREVFFIAKGYYEK